MPRLRRDFDVEQVVELAAAKVHEGWMAEKLVQGFADHPFVPHSILPHLCGACSVEEQTDYGKKVIVRYAKKKHHLDMLPYSELPENIKEYDRRTARIVFDWLQDNGWKVERA